MWGGKRKGGSRLIRQIGVRSRMWVTQARKGARAFILVCPRRVVAWRGGGHLDLGDDRHASHVFEPCNVCMLSVLYLYFVTAYPK